MAFGSMRHLREREFVIFPPLLLEDSKLQLQRYLSRLYGYKGLFS